MSFSKSVALFSLLFAALRPSMAAPTPVPVTNTLQRRVSPNTQGCSVTDHGWFMSYSIDIGVTYANGIGCNNVYNALQAPGNLAVSNWQCVDDGSGGTQLWFNTDTPGNAGDTINWVLHQEYPMVNGFNCPNN